MLLRYLDIRRRRLSTSLPLTGTGSNAFVTARSVSPSGARRINLYSSVMAIHMPPSWVTFQIASPAKGIRRVVELLSLFFKDPDSAQRIHLEAANSSKDLGAILVDGPQPILFLHPPPLPFMPRTYEGVGDVDQA